MKVISEFITWGVTSLPLKENLTLRFEPRRGGITEAGDENLHRKNKR
jgi:hypothetical protein